MTNIDNTEDNLLKKYTLVEQKNIKGKIILNNQENFEEFLKNSFNNTSFQKFYFGKIGEKLATFIKSKTGVDVNNYNLSLRSDTVKKIINSHGTEKEFFRGQIPITYEEIKNIPQVVAKPDIVSKSGTSAQGKPAITFSKDIDGMTYVVTYISDKHKNLEVQTMYKHKKIEPVTVQDVDIQPPQQTS